MWHQAFLSGKRVAQSIFSLKWKERGTKLISRVRDIGTKLHLSACFCIMNVEAA